MAKTFRDLAAFKRALDLIVDVYSVTASFPRDERYGLVAQMRRSSVGVAAQIAEGQGRLSYGEWRQFLSQARGSLFEVEAEAAVACRLGFIHDTERDRISRGVSRTGNALIGLIRWLRERERAAKKPRRNPAGTPPQPIATAKPTPP